MILVLFQIEGGRAGGRVKAKLYTTSVNVVKNPKLRKTPEKPSNWSKNPKIDRKTIKIPEKPKM